jgi:hypothetical protein
MPPKASPPFPIVLTPPDCDNGPNVQQMSEPTFVDAFVAQAPVEGLNVGVWLGLHGSIKRSCTPRSCAQTASPLPQNFLPLCPEGRLRARCKSRWTGHDRAPGDRHPGEHVA